MPAPSVVHLGSISNTTGGGGTITTPSDIPANCSIVIAIDTSFSATATDTAGNTYISGSLAIQCERTVFTPAGTVITITNTVDSRYDIAEAFIAEAIAIIDIDVRASKYRNAPADPNAPTYYGLQSAAGHATPLSYSAVAATTAYNADPSRSIIDARISDTVIVFIGKPATGNAPITDTQGADGFTSVATHAGVTRQQGPPFPGHFYTGLRIAYKIIAGGNGNGTTALGSVATSADPNFGDIFWQLYGFYKPIPVPPNDKIDTDTDKTGTRFTSAINATGQAIVYIDNSKTTATTSALTPVIVDSALTCICPSLTITRRGNILYIYQRDTTTYARISDDSGRTWSAAVALTPSGYTTPDVKWSSGHQFAIVPVFNQSDTTWYIVTGTYDVSLNIVWHTPVSTGLVGKEIAASLYMRKDGVYEFSYVDNAGAIQIKRCRKLSSLGVGAWV